MPSAQSMASALNTMLSVISSDDGSPLSSGRHTRDMQQDSTCRLLFNPFNLYIITNILNSIVSSQIIRFPIQYQFFRVSYVRSSSARHILKVSYNVTISTFACFVLLMPSGKRAKKKYAENRKARTLRKSGAGGESSSRFASEAPEASARNDQATSSTDAIAVQHDALEQPASPRATHANVSERRNPRIQQRYFQSAYGRLKCWLPWGFNPIATLNAAVLNFSAIAILRAFNRSAASAQVASTDSANTGRDAGPILITPQALLSNLPNSRETLSSHKNAVEKTDAEIFAATEPAAPPQVVDSDPAVIPVRSERVVRPNAATLENDTNGSTVDYTATQSQVERPDSDQTGTSPSSHLGLPPITTTRPTPIPTPVRTDTPTGVSVELLEPYGSSTRPRIEKDPENSCGLATQDVLEEMAREASEGAGLYSKVDKRRVVAEGLLDGRGDSTTCNVPTEPAPATMDAGGSFGPRESIPADEEEELQAFSLKSFLQGRDRSSTTPNIPAVQCPGAVGAGGYLSPYKLTPPDKDEELQAFSSESSLQDQNHSSATSDMSTIPALGTVRAGRNSAPHVSSLPLEMPLAEGQFQASRLSLSRSVEDGHLAKSGVPTRPLPGILTTTASYVPPCPLPQWCEPDEETPEEHPRVDPLSPYERHANSHHERPPDFSSYNPPGLFDPPRPYGNDCSQQRNRNNGAVNGSWNENCQQRDQNSRAVQRNLNNNSQRCRENGDRRQCSPYNNSQQRIVQRQAQLQHRYRQRDVNGNPPQVNPSILTPEVPDFKSSQVHVPQLTKESPNLNPSDVDPIIPMQEVSEEDVIVNAIWYIPHHGYLPPPPNGPFLMHSLLRYLNFPYKEPNQLIPSPMPPLPRPDTLHSRYTMTFLDLPREARRRGYFRGLSRCSMRVKRKMGFEERRYGGVKKKVNAGSGCGKM
ncbi:hypothetical protein K432DRAFT_388349 [Lepidopterella palustris CBS 459.81]|uniref:Uncharacterized protein n=1 Tax=Lepidopterella palustris CBS 459.81 TaxID=1314670 RepID=A0A8E2ELI3_9PEZI|nr:hypothetical protein K432DRAFT_388349 [Lepidopterella palustris CBS 459.81]